MGDERAGRAAVDLAAIDVVFVEHGVHYALAFRVGEKFGFIAEEAAGRHGKFQAHARAFGRHADKLALAQAHFFHDHAHAVLGHIGDEAVDGLALHAVDFLEKHLGHGDLELVALAAHIFYENGQVHFAAAADHEGLGGVTVGHAQGYVPDRLFIQAGAEVAGGDELAVLAREGRVVDHEGHFHARLAYFGELYGFGRVGVAQRVAYRNALDAGYADDVAHRGGLDGDAVKPLELVDV